MGLTLETSPLLGNAYLEKMYCGEHTNPVHLLEAYLVRYLKMGRAGGARLIWLHYEALTYMPWALEKRVFASGLPIVFDIDDAIFHRYDSHRRRLVRVFLGNKIDRVMKNSSMVLAGNGYLAERAQNAGARSVQVVPTVLDTTLYAAVEKPQRNHADCKVVGWIGSPSTWSEYMAPMMPLLGSVAAEFGAKIMAVGAGPFTAEYPNLDNRNWSEATEVPLIQEMDIGVMPLSDTPWARGKCGYKLIQYMACGLPVIASPVGVNAEIVEHGVNGFLAKTEAEWAEALRILLHDPVLRARMGVEGRRKIQQDYSLAAWGPRVAQMLRQVSEIGRQA